jgi:hypothetical protein
MNDFGVQTQEEKNDILDRIQMDLAGKEVTARKRGLVLFRLSKRRFGVLRINGISGERVVYSGELVFPTGTREQCLAFIDKESSP